MLLRQKKSQGEDQDWCVILSPIPSEIDRKKVAQKISSVFTLSLDEAADLVSNTPIIILDNLTRPVAVKLKDFFRTAGAETILTNDVFQKRKCYRTVWPEPPNLSFLQDWNASSAPSKHEQEELGPDEALKEMKNLSMETKHSVPPSVSATPFMSRTERELLAEEAERWRRECAKLREESKELQEQIERLQKENSFSSQGDSDWAEDKEKELKEVQILLDHTNEKYEVLRQEYANARHLYEEKIAGLIQDTEQSKRKIHELNDSFQSLQKEQQTALERFSQKEKDWQIVREQELKNQKESDFKNSSLVQELELGKRRLFELTESQRGLQREKELLQERLTRKEAELQSVLDENRKARIVQDQKNAKYQEESSRLEYQLKESLEKTQLFQRAKEELELNLNNQSEQIVHWRDQHERLLAKLSSLEQELHNEKTLREALEIRQKELERNQSRVIQDLEEKTRSIQDWEGKYLLTERAFAQLRETHENQEKVLQHQLKQLETRERDLEAARKQVREINAQIEHRDTIQRRTVIANQLVEKEAMLKKLVHDQEKIEIEIKAREESMRAVLTQQEIVEKEIVEAKQAQRHLAELAKREQKTVRRPGLHPESQASEDSAE